MIPSDTPRGTKVHYVSKSSLGIFDVDIYSAPLDDWAINFPKERAFLTRREAVEYCCEKLEGKIRELKESV